MKTPLSTASLILLSTVCAQASTCGSDTQGCSLSGLAVGIEASLMGAPAEVTTTPSQGAGQYFNGDGVAASSSDIGIHGGMLSMTLGYGHLFSNHMFLGVDGFFGAGSGKGVKNSTLSTTSAERTDIRLRSLFGAKARFGYAYDHVMIYGSLGYGFLNLKHHTRLYNDPGGANTLFAEKQEGKRRGALLLGGGIEIPLSPLSLGLDYTYIHGRNHDTVVPITNAANPKAMAVDTEALRTGLKYRGHHFSVTLRYRF